jgi:hypothetical protein
MAKPSSSSALANLPLTAVAPDDYVAGPAAPVLDPDTLSQTQLIGAILRWGRPALEIAVGNGVREEDWSEEGFADLFRLARSACLSSAPFTLATIAPPVHDKGLDQAAAGALTSVADLTFDHVPLLAESFVTAALYRAALVGMVSAHMELYTTMEADGGRAELCRILDRLRWQIVTWKKRASPE